MSSVTVLCDSGRRQTIKVQANTKILEILEEVCKKQGLASNEYDLVHQKKHLDITLTYRLSGLPNNAQLELRKLESGPRKISDVTVALQLDDGSRLAPQVFKPDTTSLFDLIQFYFNQNPSDLLKAVLNEENESSLLLFPVITYLNEQIVGLFQFKNMTLLDLGLNNGRFILRLSQKKFDIAEFDKLNSEFKLKLEKKLKLEEIYSKKQLEMSQQVAAESRVESEKPVNVEVNRPISQPAEPSVYREPKKPKTKHSAVEPSHNFPTVIPGLDEPQELNRQFENFKFPEATKGQNLNDLNELAEIERISKESCDRMGVIFNMEAEKSASKANEVDEEFYNVTVEDLRYMLNDLKRVQNEEEPLMTREMRELKKDKKAMKYSHIAIRVQFRNGLTLQGIFRPKETMSQLYKFVRDSFSDTNSPSDVDFQLFVSPPKTILREMNKSLFDYGLYPAACVYFKNKANSVPVFKSEIEQVNLERADEIVDRKVHQMMRQIDDGGINWLEKEHALVQNIVKTAKPSAAQTSGYVDYESSNATTSSRINDGNDEMKKKLQHRFLGQRK